MKLSSAQSTLATKASGQLNFSLEKKAGQTFVSDENTWCPAYGAIRFASLLHLDQTPYTEQVAAIQTYWFERNACTNNARIIVQVGYDG